LAQNTLLAVMTFPADIFYPVGVYALGIFVKKGIPHPKEQNVLWLRAVNDGLVKSKGRRLPSSRVPNDFNKVHSVLKAFLANQQHPVSSIERLQKACPIDFSDKLLELVPEAYLNQAIPTEEEIEEGVEQLVRETVAQIIRTRKEKNYDS